LTKIGTGTLTISAAQDYSALNADGGKTILETPLGSGSSIANVGAEIEFRADQTLQVLSIGAGGFATLSSVAPSGNITDIFSEPSASFGNERALAAPTGAVPEPTAFHLLLAVLLLRQGTRPAPTRRKQ